MGIESSIASLSMHMAQASVQSQASVKVLKNVMDASEQQAMSLIEDLGSCPPPAGSGELGGLLDVSV